jgi:hypothetical protein
MSLRQRELGRQQQAMLRHLRDQDGPWVPGRGSILGHVSDAVAVLNSLVRRGLCVREEEGWVLTEEGRRKTGRL